MVWHFGPFALDTEKWLLLRKWCGCITETKVIEILRAS